MNAENINILIVDDNDLNLEMAINVIESMGAVADGADCGQVAVDKAKTQKYDVILMDYMMPNMDGAEATKLIRSEGENVATPIIAMTAEEDPSTIQILIESGMNTVLHKPIDPGALYSALSEFTDYKLERPKTVSADVSKMDDLLIELVNMNFDVSSGIRFTGSEESYRQYLGDFVKLLPGLLNTLNTCVEKKDFERFTIEVHGLKSNFRALGHPELFAVSQMLEKLGKNGKFTEIVNIFPEYFDNCKKCSDKLKTMFGKKALLSALPTEEISIVLSELRDALDTFDLDTADYMIDKLGAHENPDEIAEDMDSLYEKVAGVRYDDAMEVIDKIIEKIKRA